MVPGISLTHRWSGQVIETPDGLPYIGRMADHQYAATGFGGNGLTFGTLAGMMVSDAILGRRNPWTELFDPGRAGDSRTGSGTTSRRTRTTRTTWCAIGSPGAEGKSLRAVKRGQGRIIERNGAKVAAYRDAHGAVTLRSAICTHMGCPVAWNPAERTWDCPCHGSRFTPKGDVISGPAESPLPRAAQVASGLPRHLVISIDSVPALEGSGGRAQCVCVDDTRRRRRANGGAAIPATAGQTPTAQTPSTPPAAVTYTVDVIETMPLPAVNLTIEQIPAPVQAAAAADIDASGALDLSDFLNRRFAGVFVNETQGNPFQPDLNYRGYTASPLLGTPQGLSVYLDGVRLNQPFGDVVSWDLIPRVAIGSTTLMPGSNPLFGLNTLGGALAIQTKDGRTSPGHVGPRDLRQRVSAVPSRSSRAGRARTVCIGMWPATSSPRTAGATPRRRTSDRCSANSGDTRQRPIRRSRLDTPTIR